MTRFWITLQQGVDFVLQDFERMHGGEIFVPKIPVGAGSSTSRRRWRPELPHRIVGIRPGEKLHEVMMTARDDSHLTLEFADHFVILPDDPVHRSRRHYCARNGLGEKGVPVAQGFEYNSGSEPTRS